MSEDQVFARHRPVRGRVLIIGVGSVGSFIADDLARMGVSLGLIDRETLEPQNLIRHILGEDYQGEPKAAALAAKIRREFPLCDVVGEHTDFLKLSEVDQIQLVQRANVVVAATDSLECQHRINEICVRAQVVAVYPGVWTGPRTGSPAEVGEIIWVPRGHRTPCFQCVISVRHEGSVVRARSGMRVDIRVLASATVSVVLALLEPGGRRAGFLDETANLILVHSFAPRSTDFEGYFEGGGAEFVEVPFPESPCPACGGRRTPVPPRHPPAEASPRTWSPPQRRKLPVARWVSILVVGLVGIIVLIAQAVSRHNANNARLAAEYAAEEAALEHAAQTAIVECHVEWSPDTGIVKRYPCSSVPMRREGYADSYWTVISLKAVSYQAASNHNISLYCHDSRLGRGDSNNMIGLREGGDLRAYVFGDAGEKEYPPSPIDCEIRTDRGATVIRKVRIAMVLDASRRFEL